MNPRACTAVVSVVLAAVAAGCGREDDDLVNGKTLFIERCGSCHALDRADTSGTAGPDLDAAFRTARNDGLGEKTIAGVVEDQIAHPGRSSGMPADLVTGDDAEDVAAYVAEVAGVPGEDTGRSPTPDSPARPAASRYSRPPVAAAATPLMPPARLLAPVPTSRNSPTMRSSAHPACRSRSSYASRSCSRTSVSLQGSAQAKCPTSSARS